MSTSDDAVRTVRRDLLDHLRPPSFAWSVDGRDVTFTASFDDDVEVGGFVTVVTTDGRRVPVQVTGVRLASREGIRIDVDTTELAAEATGLVRSANVGMIFRYIEGEGHVLGPAGAPFGEAALEPATADEVQALLAADLGSSVGLAVGRLSSVPVDASLRAAGFARHTFLCGQSGSGKTYSLGALLERLLLDTDLPIIVVDPNSDYVGLGSLRTRAQINASRSTPMSAAAYRDLQERYRERADVAVARATGGDLPLRIHLSDLTLVDQALTLDLDPVRDADEFAAYADAIAALASDRYDITQVSEVLHHRFDEASRRLAQRIQNLRIASWSVWATVDEPSIAEAGLGRRALVLDTGSLTDPRERSVIALALLGRLHRRPQRNPIAVVIDEAHNVCSPDAATAIERAVADHTVWIAGEGRKFGIYMILSTQRPQKVHRNVISQCDNLLLMRVNSLGDLEELATVFSHVPRPMVLEARSFRLGEVLAAGPIAPTPMRLRMGERWSPEGGADLPTTWASRRT